MMRAIGSLSWFALLATIPIAAALQLSTSTKRASKKTQIIKFVPWAGKRGMLPHQYYSGVLTHKEYHHWLQIPLKSNASFPNANVERYFSTLCTKQNVDPPEVKPKHLRPIYIDNHIIVVNKPSGVLSVPGPRRHECVASLAYRYFGKSNLDMERSEIYGRAPEHTIEEEKDASWRHLAAADNKQIDTMVVHRLDRDTSGVLLFARNDNALKQLHNDFKDKNRKKASKKYVALVCGHMNSKGSGIAADEGEINLPLVRDMERPPFMRVATVETALQQEQFKQQSQVKNGQQQCQHSGYLRMVGKEAKASLTTYNILAYEYLIDNGGNDNTNATTNTSPRLLPVTRVELQPLTGRTNQLRVHCAAIGHPIVGDSIYGYEGEGSPRGGLNSDEATGASTHLQRKIDDYWTRQQQPHNSDKHEDEAGDEKCMLCLHAYQLSVFHPFTESPMIFQCSPPF